jgi:hypothetical protein
MISAIALTAVFFATFAPAQVSANPLIMARQDASCKAGAPDCTVLTADQGKVDASTCVPTDMIRQALVSYLTTMREELRTLRI